MSRSELDPSSLQEHAPDHGRLRKHSWFGVGALSGVLVMGGVALSPIVGQLFAQQPSSSRDAPREQPSDGRPSNRDRPGQTGPREYPRSSDEERAGWLEEGRAGDRRPAVGRPSDAAGQPGSPYDAQPRSDVLFESRAPNSIPYYMPGGGSPSGPNVYNGQGGQIAFGLPAQAYPAQAYAVPGQPAAMMPPHSYGTQTIYSTHTAAAMTPEEVQLQAKLMPWVERLRGNKLPDDQRERLEEELEGAVKEIFEAKHQRQQEHLERLKKEVAETEKLLKEREAHKDEIVSRRVKELLGSPDPLSWDADVTRGPYRSGTVVSGYCDTAVPGQPFPVVRPLPGQSVPAVIGPSAAPQPSSQPPQGQQRGRGQPRSPEHDEARPQPPTPPSPPAPPRDPNATRGPEEREPPKPE